MAILTDTILHKLSRSLHGHADAGATDGELLESFPAGRDSHSAPAADLPARTLQDCI